MAWPSVGEARAYVDRELGIDYPVSGEMLAAAIAELESLTGWRPYQGETATRYFNPPGSAPMAGGLSGGGTLLSLREGLISVTSLTISGQSRTVNTDFWLEGRAGPEAYTLIRFAFPVWGRPRSIAINGLWGRETSAGDAARRAVLCLVGKAVSQNVASSRPGMSGWRDGDISEDYGYEMTRSAGEALGLQAASLIASISNRMVY